MNAKLAINLSEGTVDVEGSEEFVRLVYQDFKGSLEERVVRPPRIAAVIEHDMIQSPAKKENGSERRKLTRNVTQPELAKFRMVGYKPKFNNSLDLSGLKEFYDGWSPDNNSEKILLFAIFLRDKLNITPCSADDIYTCFFTLRDRTKIPTAFIQAFHNAQTRTHFIEFVSVGEIRITIAGENHFSQMKKAQSSV